MFGGFGLNLAYFLHPKMPTNAEVIPPWKGLPERVTGRRCIAVGVFDVSIYTCDPHVDVPIYTESMCINMVIYRYVYIEKRKPIGGVPYLGVPVQRHSPI